MHVYYIAIYIYPFPSAQDCDNCTLQSAMIATMSSAQ